MKKLIQIIVMVSLSLSMQSQATFELILSESADQISVDIFETEDGYIVNELNKAQILGRSIHTQLYKLDFDGRVIEKIRLRDSIYEYSIEKIIPKENNHFLGFGYQKQAEDSVAFFTIVEMGENFDILSEKAWRTQMRNFGSFNVEYIDNYYYVVATGKNLNNNLTSICAFKLSDNLNLLISEIYSDKTAKGLKMSFSLLPHSHDKNMSVFVLGYHQQTNTSGQILIIDSLLNIVDIHGIPEDVNNPTYAKYINPDTYLLSGRKYIYNSYPRDEQLAIMKMDNNDSMQDIHLVGAIDTVEYPGNYSNLDFTDTNNIFFGGTKNISLATTWSSQPSWFVLNKFNSNLELKWQKFYGGDAYYTLWCMRATQDDGCLMAGTRYDYLTQMNERDSYIAKVNQDGLIVGTGEELPNITVQDAIVYPNPGDEYLKVQSGPQIKGALFELFDMRGNLVLSATLDESLKTLNTSELSLGTYPYRVNYNNKIVTSGKWIKQ